MVDRQYYAHPRNTFWWIMANILGFDENEAYSKRCLALEQCKVAVWDVLHDCNRPGSLDSSIVKGSEKANDFKPFFESHSGLQLVAFNGGTAKTLFMRYHKSLTLENSRMRFQQLPSTSPAHASMTREEKLLRWKAELSPCLN